jgi:hypothetical protein
MRLKWGGETGAWSCSVIGGGTIIIPMFKFGKKELVEASKAPAPGSGSRLIRVRKGDPIANIPIFVNKKQKSSASLTGSAVKTY